MGTDEHIEGIPDINDLPEFEQPPQNVPQKS
jgi:hypothetical protein